MNWKIKELSEAQQHLCEQLSKELHISSLSAQMLVDRGITTADEARTYIRPSLDQLHDPFLMRDMDKAVERLHRALTHNETILVYGDYDVDGTTSVALVYSFLYTLHSQLYTTLHSTLSTLHYYIPDRYTEGYGISFRGIDYAQSIGATLIIALDCGIKAVDKVDYATQKGIDFIICDHHTPGDTLPAAVAVLDMEREDDSYPYKHLSGCGVGFKLCQAYTQRYLPAQRSFSESGPSAQRSFSAAVLYSLLQFCAMSIASDIVPLTGENRLLAYFGLQQLNTQPFIGPQALIQTALGGKADGSKPTLNITDLMFKIGPRINACGRMKTGTEAVKLLLSTDLDEALALAQAVDQYNQERKGKEDTITQEALEQLQANPDNDSLATTVVYNPSWHKGVVGIAASKLIETYYRPTIVLTSCSPEGGLSAQRSFSDSGLISGSARSVEGFDLYSAIDACSDLLTTFGGHLFAAGLTMPEANLPEFKKRFEQYVQSHILPEQKQPTLQIEAEIDLADITPQLLKVLKCLEPFGPENPRPLFLTRKMINNRYTKRCGKTGEHLKLDLPDRTSAISGIAFGKGDMALYIQNGNPVDVVYELTENTFNGVTSIEMMVRDLQPS